MTTRNPFPGMNPFFEKAWGDAHSRLIAYIADDLQPRLPADLVARANERTGAIVSAETATRYYPDVKVSEFGSFKEGAEATLVADEPVLVMREEEPERWIEISDGSGKIITVVELLSPSNKRAGGFDQYLEKRRNFIRGGINVVEIDLVRQGRSVFSTRVQKTLQNASALYGVSVFRAANSAADEVYPIRLREPLPVIRIPLRRGDVDVLLSLQPLINQCHERGRYHLLEYRANPEPPFSPEDAAWINAVLRDAGLRQ